MLIGSLILGASAPMISKQIKHNNFSDAQALVLSRKIEEINSAKWFKTPDNSITRPDNNVGIGVAKEGTPEAKLEVNNTNSNLLGFLLKVPANQSENIFSISSGGNPKLWMTGSGVLGFGITKDGINRERSMITISEDGIMDFLPPYNAKYESDNGGSPAIRVAYPKDSDAKYDNWVDKYGKWGYPTNDGTTNTFLLTSYGSTYINSVAPSGVALAVRNGATERAVVYNTGKTYIRLKQGAKWGLIIKDDAQNNLFVVNEDGSTYVKGEISNPDLNTKFAKINNELGDAKELIAKSQETIAELKAENTELKEKLASFESQLSEIIAINNLQKIVQNK